jgi:hypothetical protein
LTAGNLERVGVTGRVQPEVADLLEARWQHVLDEAVQKVDGMQALGLAVLGAEGNGVRTDIDEPTVSDGDAMGVTAEVAKEMLGAPEGPLGVDAPALVCEPRGQAFAGFWILERIVALKQLASVHAVKKVEHLAAEDLGHDFYGEEVLATSRLPRASAIEHAGGDDRVQVRMKSEVACPGVQDDGDTEHAAEASLSEFEQSLAGCAKQRLE